jgi:hypothetical protein
MSARQIAMVAFYPIKGPFILFLLGCALMFSKSFGVFFLGSLVVALLVGNLIYLWNSEIEILVDEKGIYLQRKPAERAKIFIPIDDVRVISIENVPWFRLSIDNLGFVNWGVGNRYYFLNPGTMDRYVVLELTDGRHVSIGSAREVELACVLQELVREHSSLPVA